MQFRSAAPHAVCGYCQSLLVRKDVTLESIGRVAEVPEDFSPLQLHTSGVFDGQRFTLIGRVRKAWEQGSWNEWCALFDDQRLGWLAEAQGDWVMTFEEHPDQDIRRRIASNMIQALTPGTRLKFQDRMFTVSDVKSVVCLGAEGELLSAAGIGEPMRSIDMRGEGVAFGTIESSGDYARVFLGRHVDFAECRFTGLRTLEGWPLPSSTSR